MTIPIYCSKLKAMASTTYITSIALSVATATLPLFTHSSLAESQPQPLNENSSVNSREDPYDFTGDGRSGRRTSGGSRGDCSQIDLDTGLTALVPTANWGKTVAEHPTLWFYVPYSPQQAPVGVFVIQDEDYSDIYRARFTLPSSAPGLVSISLPKEASPLVVGESYRWQLNLYCSADATSAPVYVSGWLEPVSSSAGNSLESLTVTNQHEMYANQGIWFDAIHHLAQLRQADPSDPSLFQDWQILLQAQGVNLEELKDVPFSGQVQWIPTADVAGD
jgi:hypothetical protein